MLAKDLKPGDLILTSTGHVCLVEYIKTDKHFNIEINPKCSIAGNSLISNDMPRWVKLETIGISAYKGLNAIDEVIFDEIPLNVALPLFKALKDAGLYPSWERSVNWYSEHFESNRHLIDKLI